VSLSRCITCQDICVQLINSHMQGSHSVISNKPRLHTTINPYYRTIKTEPSTAPAGGQWCPAPHLTSMPPISFLAPRLLYSSNITFKKCCSPCGLWSPLVRNPGDGFEWKPRRFMLPTKTMSVPIWFETIIEYWFNYSPSFKFSSATKTSTFGRPFLLHKTFFITLVIYPVDDISH